jgi:hypothetical protein
MDLRMSADRPTSSFTSKATAVVPWPERSTSRLPPKLGQCSIKRWYRRGLLLSFERESTRLARAPIILVRSEEIDVGARTTRPPWTRMGHRSRFHIVLRGVSRFDERGDEKCTHQSEEICVTILQTSSVCLMIGMRHCKTCILLHFVSNTHTVNAPKSPRKTV